MSFYIIFLVPLTVVVGYYLGGVFTFLTPVIVFGVIPLFDILIGVNKENPPPEEEAALSDMLFYRIITMLCVPVQVIMVFWGAFVIARGVLTPMEIAGFTISMGVSSGILGINVSHELLHRVNLKIEPFLSRIILWTVLYMHWAIEHVAGHHKNVATPMDPETARLSESFYAFWFRTVFGGMRSSWNIEVTRLKKKNLRSISVNNRIILYAFSEIILLAGLFTVLGLSALAYFIFQSIVAFSLLEIVNYVEHYGLLRVKDSNGRYEPVTFVHAWNSSNWLTNRFLFNLQRHSDHHYKPDRRYQILRHFDDSPQLPTGYAGMIVLAAIPPLWRVVMDRRVKYYRIMEKSEA